MLIPTASLTVKGFMGIRDGPPGLYLSLCNGSGWAPGPAGKRTGRRRPPSPGIWGWGGEQSPSPSPYDGAAQTAPSTSNKKREESNHPPSPREGGLTPAYLGGPTSKKKRHRSAKPFGNWKVLRRGDSDPSPAAKPVSNCAREGDHSYPDAPAWQQSTAPGSNQQQVTGWFLKRWRPLLW